MTSTDRDSLAEIMRRYLAAYPEKRRADVASEALSEALAFLDDNRDALIPALVALPVNDYGGHLTDDEALAMHATCRFVQAMYRIIEAGDDGSGCAEHDRAEIVDKVHQLQHLVMANAFARAVCPNRFRVLGGKFLGDEPAAVDDARRRSLEQVSQDVRALLVRADSVCSLVAHRHPSEIPADVVEELVHVSHQARALTQGHDR